MATARKFVDRWGHRVRLTRERLGHLQQHPEMVGLEEEIGRTLAEPGTVVQSSSDDSIRLYYRWVPESVVGGKYLCVVVKFHGGEDAFIVTAYLTDRVKKGGGGMDKRAVRVWYDREGDYLEVLFDCRAGYFRETDHDQVMEKVDSEGNVIGFSILNVSSLAKRPLEVALS